MPRSPTACSRRIRDPAVDSPKTLVTDPISPTFHSKLFRDQRSGRAIVGSRTRLEQKAPFKPNQTDHRTTEDTRAFSAGYVSPS